MRNILLFTLISLLLAACGKKGALIYPDMLVPAPPASFSAMQSGNTIKISFLIPDKDRAGRKTKDIAGIKILRLESPSGQASACRDCAGYILFKTLYSEIPVDAQRYGALTVLLDGNVGQGREYAYKAVAFTKEGIDGEVALPLFVKMVQPPEPPVLRIIPTPTELRLEFTEGRVSAEGKVFGYNIYRKQKGEAWPYLPINSKPIKDTHFSDTGLDKRERYIYVVRGVIRLPANQMLESKPSNEVEGVLKDEE